MPIARNLEKPITVQLLTVILKISQMHKIKYENSPETQILS